MKKVASFCILFLLLFTMLACTSNKESKEAKLDIVSAQLSIGKSIIGEEYQTFSYEIRIENVGEAPINVKEMKVIFSNDFEKLMPENVNKELFTKSIDEKILATDFITFLNEIPFETGEMSKEKISELTKIEGIMVTLQSGEKRLIPLNNH